MLLLLLLLQDPLPLDSQPPEAFRVSIGASGRLSILAGTLGEVTATPAGMTIEYDALRWFDCFDLGVGGSIELFAGLSPQPRGGLVPPAASLFGLYAAFDVAIFEGALRSDGLVSIEPDEFTATSLFIGIKGGTLVDKGITGDLLLGVGAVRIDAVDADFRFNTTTSPGELLEESVEFAAEARLRFGVHAGPFLVSLGTGVRGMTPPDPGRDADFHPGIPWVLDFELAIEARF